MPRNARYENLQERIIANSVVDDGGPITAGEFCWLWLGKTRVANRGSHYPAMTLRYKRGPRKGKVYNASVHRVAIRVFKNRTMSHRQVAMHLCDNSLCVNHAHLAGGTQKKNVQDTVARGRHRNGAS